jgi:hypothetical protein
VGAGRRAIAGLAIVWLLAPSLAARADVIELTNGQRIVGTVKEATATSVVIQVSGHEMRIWPADVQSITFEPSGPATGTTPSPPPVAPTMPSPTRGEAPPPPTELAPPLAEALAAPTSPDTDSPTPPPEPSTPAPASAERASPPSPTESSASPPEPVASASSEASVAAPVAEVAPTVAAPVAPAAPPAEEVPLAGAAPPVQAASPTPTTTEAAPPGVASAAPPEPATPLAMTKPDDPSTPPAPAAPLPPLSPSIGVALAALERLQAATLQALTPADYAAKVEEARREFAPALADSPDQVEILHAVDAALRYHTLAAHAGGVYEARGDLAAIGRDPVAAECRPLAEMITHNAEGLRLNPSDPAVVGLLVATEGAPALRTCAGEQIEAAELRAKAHR